MVDVRRRYRRARRRIRRIERRELREFRAWLETTANLLHVTVLVAVPVLIGLVTWLSNAVDAVSFLLFPPLASGAYTLFADPEGRYASPRRFVAGMTAGALCGWLAVEGWALAAGVSPAALGVSPGAAAFGVFLTGAVTWALGIELPTAFSAALLVLVTGTTQLAYVLGVMLSAGTVAGVFAVWREQFYERRARYLYRTVQSDDHVLVPMRGPTAPEAAMLGARIAGAHDAAKVVLLDVVGDEAVARAERAALDGEGESDATAAAEREAAAEAAEALEERARHVEAEAGVPCEIIVAAAGDDGAATALAAAEEADCDLVVTPYETDDGRLSAFVRGLFAGDIDVVAFRSVTGSTGWERVMVPVAHASDAAHAMIDYAERLAGLSGSVSICTCIDTEDERRWAESMLADLAETVSGRVETRVSRTDVTAFLQRNDRHYDLVFVGASTRRSAASRFLSPPTFERVGTLETDVAVVHVP